ncbi:Sister chromatid cohesion protein pds5 [Massospora cicadina]|nr:Sister chromatid cohesion protein pds5 [Massospora cicadina]
MAPSNKKVGKDKRTTTRPTPKAIPSVLATEAAVEGEEKVLPSAEPEPKSFIFEHPKLIRPTQLNTDGELQVRLRELYGRLFEIKSQEFEPASFKGVAEELIKPRLIASKDDGVRVLTGCCLAEVLRLCAPNSPFSGSEIVTIFHLFLDLFERLPGEEGAFSQFYTSILYSTATVKTIHLIAAKDEQLVQDYFIAGFNLAESSLARDKVLRLVDILEQLAQETDNFSTQVVELILKQFNKQRQLECPHAFAMASSICSSAPDRLQGPICQYFIDVLSGTKEEEEESRPSMDLEQAHSTIQMLYTVAPRVLLSVIPQLEAQLTVVKPELRRLSLETLGALFTLPSAASLLAKYPTLWKSWIQRRADQVVQIRILLLHLCAKLFGDGTPAYAVADICDAVGGLVVDLDERVRAAACQLVAQLPYGVVKRHIPAALLKKVAARLRDKKASVRRNLPHTITALYVQAVEDLDRGDLVALEKFRWIPEELLEIVYSNDPQIILDAERAFRTTILGTVDDLEVRTGNLLRVVTGLEQHAYVGLRALQTWQTSLSRDFRLFLAACREFGGESSEGPATKEQLYSRITLVVKRMMQRFPEPQKLYESLLRYPKSNDRKLNDLLEAVLDAGAPAAAQLPEREALKRIGQLMPALSEVFGVVLLRLSPTLICREMVPVLTRIASQETRLSSAAHQLLKDLPAIDPTLLHGHIPKLGDLVLGFRGGAWLPTLAHHAKAAPDARFPADRVAKRLAQLVLEGPADQARDAAAALSLFDTGLKHSTRAVESIVSGLAVDSPQLAGHLAALDELVAKHPELTEKHMPAVLGFILKSLLPCPSELLKAKTTAITMLTSRAIAYAQDGVKQRLVQPVFALLWSILERKGEVASNSSPELLSQMRLAAAIAVLNLAACPAYEAMVPVARFNLLATTIQDPLFEVREKFGEAVMNRLGQRKLNMKFLTILFLVAFDPEAAFKARVRGFIKQLLLTQATTGDSARIICSALTRLLHLLAHDSDFKLSTPDLLETAKFIEFFLDAAATEDNISLIHSAACYIKRTEDALEPPLNQNLYAVGDLAVYVINYKRLSHGWIITPHPAALQLPRDLFRPLSRRPDGQPLGSKSYLPADFFDQASRGLLTPSQFRDKLERPSAPKPTREVALKRPAEEAPVPRRNPSRNRVSKKLATSDGTTSDGGVSVSRSD